MAVYTKTGDKGTTSLVGGTRVAKTDCRLEAYGSVDELSTFVAHLRDGMVSESLLATGMEEEKEELLTYLSTLMNISSRLASEDEWRDKMPEVGEDDVNDIERAMDRISACLEPIKQFTLPGGHSLVSLAHIARSVCRRAERAILRVEESGYSVDEGCRLFINRLSDYLYLLSRLLTKELNISELYWKGKNTK